MGRSSSFFELHVGFPADGVSAAAAQEFRQSINDAGSMWTRSLVTGLNIKNPSCMDPHNVPGTLGSLVSRSIEAAPGENWDAIVDGTVLPACEAALETLVRAKAGDARLEIECPFGWMTAEDGADGSFRRSIAVHNPVRIPHSRLNLRHGHMMSGTPEWEIHFVAQPLDFGKNDALTIENFPELVEQQGVDVEQTIQYRSNEMLVRGADAFKYIATSYYPTPADVEADARRVFETTTLCEELWSRGYRLTLILEHIVACFQPATRGVRADYTDVSDEVIHAD